MFVKDNLEEIKTTIANHFPNPGLLTMLIAIVIAPLALFAIGGRTQHTLWQSGLAWSFLIIALMMFVSAGRALLISKHGSHGPNQARRIPITRPRD